MSSNKFLFKKLCQMPQCGSANLWQTCPPGVTEMILPSITNTLKGARNKWLRFNRLLLPVTSAAFSVIFRINDTWSQGMAAAPITTTLVAAIRRTTLSWLHGFESPTRHFPRFQHLIIKKNYCRRTRWVFKISHVEVSAALKWHEITVCNYQHSRHSQMSLGVFGTQLRVISVAPAGVDMNHCHRLECLL